MNIAVTTLRSVALLLAVLLQAGCVSGPQPHSAAETVRALYSALEELSVSGAPSADELDVLSPWLGDELEQLLVQARTLHDRERERSPDEKPPFNDGDLFSSLFEGPTSFEVGTPIRNGDGWRVPVALTYASPGGTPDWSDTVLVAREAGGYVVTDVRYGGNWDFAPRGTLIDNLRAGLAMLPETVR